MLEHFVQERDIQTADGLSPQEILHQISRQHMLRLNANIKF